MKKVIVIAALVIVGNMAIGCASDKKDLAKTEFYCPMKCEGEVTYVDKDKKCPVCKMTLVEKKDKSN